MRRALRLGAVLLIAGLAWSAALAGPAGPSDPAAAPPAAPRLPAGAYVLGADKIPEMLRPCSRDAPAPGEGSWVPDAATIIALERLLPEALAKQRAGRAPPIFPHHMARQYVGIVRQGRRYVYGNFAPARMLPYRPAKDVMLVCDGGPSFFGVEYDVEARSISHLAFNGIT